MVLIDQKWTEQAYLKGVEERMGTTRGREDGGNLAT